MRKLIIGLAAALVFAGPATGAPATAVPAPAGPPPILFKSGAVTISQGGRSVTLQVEVADRSAARRRGLMFRGHLPEGEGMLFIYPRSGPRAFWMKNIRIPLSIAYIASNWRIDEIRHMDPPGAGGDAPTYPSKEPVRYALEVNRGWFERNGFTPGARVAYRPGD
ncbi:MAG: DUF192 domain-containing protein [Nitrospinota bacterium]